MQSNNQSRRILILGGGTAGWMTAMIMARHWQKQEVSITLLESSDIGIIGVGEGSTPALKQFFDMMDIREQEWMPACNATYKVGITFSQWSVKPGFESYFHPFKFRLDEQFSQAFFHSALMRRQGIEMPAHPNQFFLAPLLAEKHLAPLPHYNFPFEPAYGYHFDSALLGRFLKEKAQELGVRHKEGKVNQVIRSDSGHILSLLTEQGEQIDAELFVDCSGFAGVLMQKSLKVPFVGFESNLFNDAAVAIPSPPDSHLPSQTLSTAMKHGWRWQIPLTNRNGNGYVYSSKYCSADEAETELRSALGLLNQDVPARHLKMKVGRLEKHWHKNCLAIGLSQGFIEPLEATALFLVQQAAALFVDAYEKGQFTEQNQDAYNASISGYFEGIRDYIVGHYITSSRTDSPYWLDCQNNQQNLSDTLRHILDVWHSGGNLAEELRREHISRYYSPVSWHCLLAGTGTFPDPDKLRPPSPTDKQVNIRKIQEFLYRCSLNFDPQHQYLQQRNAEQMP
ncbi:tryptophan halogenase family protein [Lacimicrobium alkaliphilum]|uniref:Tryptophan halogenase n=1 Tax=Lacimicrobium alkaliphilum TaxID=1526571 RepID=A0A0U3AIH8_9ALTE|nr:tryptophan halogenase family protein [Lacimicrobium alkaliphilum]ALS98513.1 tryptophan halogenase [Lacimicrobium alkaliphilum]